LLKERKVFVVPIESTSHISYKYELWRLVRQMLHSLSKKQDSQS